MIGVMTVPEAVRLAEDKGLDLIEIVPNATPPTCKIMDFGKYKYEKKKQEAAARKKQIIVVIKEIQMRPRTDQHDFETKMRHARRFLLEGDKVKINMRFSGREMAHQEFGISLMRKAIEFVSDLSMVETQPKMEGKQMFTLLTPDAVKVKDYIKAHPDAVKKAQAAAPGELKQDEKDEKDDE